ncbi:hypothetical protein L0244_10050, partial [bacterium]|nr:hypothetical protein [bacterium]
AIRQSQLNQQLKPIDERLNTKGNQFIGDSKTIAQSGLNLPGWDAKSIEASNRDEVSNILGGDHKDPSGQKDYLDALNKSNPTSDEQIMKDAAELTKQQSALEGGSKLGNKVRDGLSARGIAGAYADRIDGGANTKVEHGKDNGTRLGPDVSTLSPAFEESGFSKEPFDSTKLGFSSGPSSKPGGTIRDTRDPREMTELYNEHGIRVLLDASGERVVKGGTRTPLVDRWKGVEYRVDSEGHVIRIQRNKDGTVTLKRDEHAEILLNGEKQSQNPQTPPPPKKPAKQETKPAPPSDAKKEKPPSKKREPVKPQSPKKMDTDYKDGLRGEIDNADVLAFQQNGPVNPAPEPLSGRNEAQIDRLAEGVAIGIMSKINPKPYDNGGPSGPIVVGGNPIADPLEPPVPKRTNIKPRKPDGPIGPGGNSPVTPGSGGEQLSDPDDPRVSS